jgi:hypothetical protein
MHESIDVVMLAGLNDRSAGAANRIRAKTLPKDHALPSELIDIGCWIDTCEPPIVGADRVRRVIVREDENDIRPIGGDRQRGD